MHNFASCCLYRCTGLQEQQRHCVNCSPGIARAIKPRMGPTGHVARMGRRATEIHRGFWLANLKEEDHSKT